MLQMVDKEQRREFERARTEEKSSLPKYKVLLLSKSQLCAPALVEVVEDNDVASVVIDQVELHLPARKHEE